AHGQGIESYAIEVAVQPTGIPILTHAAYSLVLYSKSVVVQVDDRADGLSLDLGGIVTRLLDLVQVGLVDIASYVLAVGHRAVEALDLDLATANRFDQVRQVLIDQPVGADQIGNVLGGTIVW